MDKINIGGQDAYYIDSDDPVIYYLKKGVLYGENNFKLLDQLIFQASGTILDCGSHIGTFAIPASKTYNVICVEAAEKNLQCLNATFEHIKTVEVCPGILAEEEKPCSFSTESGPFGMLVEDENGIYTTITIDQIVEDYNITDLVGIKLDIEGGEINALLGAQTTLSKQCPPMLVEVNGHCLRLNGKLPQDLFGVIDSLGYNIYLYINGHIIQINSQKKYPFCVSDVMCIHKSKIELYSPIFQNAREMTDDEIAMFLELNYKNSNQDCKNYFDTIRN